MREAGAWAVVPLTAAEGMKTGGLHTCELEDAPRDRTVYLLRRSMTKPSEELASFLELLREDVTARGAQWLGE